MNNSEKWLVISVGGPIGSTNREGYGRTSSGKFGYPIAEFDNDTEAKEKAKRMRKLLSVGEKKYYRMTYVTCKTSDFHKLNND